MNAEEMTEADWVKCALLTGQSWMLNPVLRAMGAWYEFDFTGDNTPLGERLGNCYELAARAFLRWDGKGEAIKATGVPTPHRLVHGSWHGPDAPERIDHAWVVLAGGEVWEPITKTLCDRETFYSYCRAVDHVQYSETESKINMLRHGHYGTWPVSGNEEK